MLRLRRFAMSRPRIGIAFVTMRAVLGNLWSRLGSSGGDSVSFLLYDRESRARDNAETYFRHLVEKYPQLRVAFAIEKNSKCGRRLTQDGLGSYLVQPNSPVFWHLFRNAEIVASSQNVLDLHERTSNLVYGKKESRKIIYLRHGVMHQGFENFAKLHSYDVICCSTKEEFRELGRQAASIGKGLGSGARMTGMARFDEFSRVKEKQREKNIVIIPTWRPYARKGLKRVTSERMRYLEEWRGVFQILQTSTNSALTLIAHDLLDEKLVSSAKEHGIAVREFRDLNFAESLKTCELLISDHSSVLFDAIFCYTPILSFRFDESAHGRKGRASNYDLLRERGWHICENSDCVASHITNDNAKKNLAENVSKLRQDLFADLPDSVCSEIDELLGLS